MRPVCHRQKSKFTSSAVPSPWRHEADRAQSSAVPCKARRSNQGCGLKDAVGGGFRAAAQMRAGGLQQAVYSQGKSESVRGGARQVHRETTTAEALAAVLRGE